MTEEAFTLLDRIQTFSPYFRHILSREPSLVEELFLQGGVFTRPTFSRLQQRLHDETAEQKDFISFCSALRRFKHRELLRLAVRDLGGWDTFTQTVKGISNLACLGLAAALQFCLSERGAPFTALGRGFAVLALGKLGGEELNFSSDIDLVFVYHPAPTHLLPEWEQRGFFQALAQRLIRVMTAPVEGDHFFRVDLNLRPGGKDSEPVLSREAIIEYFRGEARPWERMAWIKARPVAGNLALGRGLLDELEPLIYRRFLDYTVFEEIRSWKRRILCEAGSRGLKGEDVKLGPGGIREIEFLVQTLQLVFGGRIPSLRERNTLKALVKLKDSSILSGQAARRLASAYRFLRTLEHRLQMVHQQQTHSLPRDPTLLSAVAAETPNRGGKGFPSSEALLHRLQHIRGRVRQAFEDLLPEPGLPSQEDLGRIEDLFLQVGGEVQLNLPGFRNGETAREILLSWHRRLGGAKPTLKRILERLYPLLFRLALETPDPDQALMLADGFLRAVGGRTGLLALLLERSSLTREIIHLFAQSRMMGRLFVHNPEMMEYLALQKTVGPRPLQKTPMYRKGGKALAEEDPLERLAALRRRKTAILLGVALEELTGVISAEEASRRLSDAADFVLQETLEWTEAQLVREGVPAFRSGHLDLVPSTSMCVLGLGKWGGKELGYLSDLDMIFIYASEASEFKETTVAGGSFPSKKVVDPEALVRLAQRLISYLSLPLREGPGYSVDTRLRPSGRAGPLIVSLEAFEAYYRERAWNWEKQALLKARVVAGPSELAERIRRSLLGLLFGVPPTVEVRGEVIRYRLRMEKERAGEVGGRINPKLGFGGLADIEFITQYLQWTFGGKIAEVRETNTLLALKALMDSGCLAPDLYHPLCEAYQFLNLLDHGLQLVYDRKGDPRTYLPEELSLLAERKVMGLRKEDFPGRDVLKHYRKVTQQVRRLLYRIFEVSSPPPP